MKASGWLKPRRYPKKPSLVLGFLLAVVLAALVVFVVWERTGRLYGIEVERVGLEKAQWVILIGAMGAVVGWITSAMITVRNSIKQHTINTLLQSRISATYTDNAKAVNKRYFGPNCLYYLTARELAEGREETRLAELSYLLNYLEFIAAAVRFGDLDEKLMRMTLRGMLCNIYEVSEVYIRNSRMGNSAAFEHLAWLYAFWFDPALKRPATEREPAPPANPQS